ncbi:hypothetical protein C7387_1635 [Yokenella regensburgei]|uniref:Uncharacterized protein n=1 Tax=Yokenella regensburgei TaxID=158877 RepID=A0ABX9S3S7_9ENTR|nr:hypothetical protein C7387_1635 [Yokenella regensburgei]
MDCAERTIGMAPIRSLTYQWISTNPFNLIATIKTTPGATPVSLDPTTAIPFSKERFTWRKTC